MLVVSTLIAFLTVLIGAIVYCVIDDSKIVFRNYEKIVSLVIGYSYLVLFLILVAVNIFLML